MRTGPYDKDESRVAMIKRLIVDEYDAFKDNYEKLRYEPTYPDEHLKSIQATYRKAFESRMDKVHQAITKSQQLVYDLEDGLKQSIKVHNQGEETVFSMTQEGRTSGARYATPNIKIGHEDSGGDLQIDATLSNEFGEGGHTYIILATRTNAIILHHIYANLLKRKLYLVREYSLAYPHVCIASRLPQEYEDKKCLRVPALRSPPRLDAWIVPKGRPFGRVVKKSHLVYLARCNLDQGTEYAEATGGLLVPQRDIEHTDLVIFETERALEVVFEALNTVKRILRLETQEMNVSTRSLHRTLSKANLEPLGYNRLFDRRDRSISPPRSVRPSSRARHPTPPPPLRTSRSRDYFQHH